MRDYSFGDFLHELRLRRGLTQFQLGALAGVSDKAVSKGENGSSKPQSNILYKLSRVLGVSVDELLTCKYHSSEKQEAKGVFAMKKQLWNKAFDTMCTLYGKPAPVEITNRFLAEQIEMQNTDIIVYFDFLSLLASNAKKQGEYIRVEGGTGASFVAYLLGAVEINPLKPHYRCPECHSVIFDNNADDGWDLPPKRCICGKEMQSDGHNIPFETYRHVVYKSTSFDISVSPEYILSAKSIVQEYFRDCKLTSKEREPNKVITFAVSSEKAECSITLCVNEEFTRYKEMKRATATCFERVPFACGEVLKEFRECNIQRILEFESEFMKHMLRSVSPQSFRELIQILGLSHGTGTWIDNGDKLIQNSQSAVHVIAYRDDIFNYIQEKMLAKGCFYTGFAYKVMEDTRRGIYAKHGVPHEIKRNLKELGAEDWFIDSIGKIKYLFPKAHGVTHIQLASTLLWYKIHYPKEFHKIMDVCF